MLREFARRERAEHEAVDARLDERRLVLVEAAVLEPARHDRRVPARDQRAAALHRHVRHRKRRLQFAYTRRNSRAALHAALWHQPVADGQPVTRTRTLRHESRPELQLPPVQRVREVEQLVHSVCIARVEQRLPAAAAAAAAAVRLLLRGQQLVLRRVRLEPDALEPRGHLLRTPLRKRLVVAQPRQGRAQPSRRCRRARERRL